MRRTRMWFSALLAVLILPGGFVAGAHAAQEQGDPTHPVAIHAGTCDDFDPEPVYDLGAISPDFSGVMGVDPGEDDTALTGFPGAMPVATANETLEATFGDVFTDDPPHSVVVHTGSEPGDEALACGELGGIEDDGRIMVGLYPGGDSGFAGVGVFDEDDAGFLGLGDDEVHVTIYLVTLDAAPDAEITTPAATPLADGEAVTDGFVNEDWLVDVAWLDERFDPEGDEDELFLDLAVIGVLPADTQETELPPNTSLLEPAQVVPVETTDEAVEAWRGELLVQSTGLGPAMETNQLEEGQTIVLFDDGSFGAAAAWWAFDYLGHEDKRLLDGGIDAWTDETEFPGGGVPAGVGGPPLDPENAPESLSAGLNEDVLATMEDVEGALEDPRADRR